MIHQEAWYRESGLSRDLEQLGQEILRNPKDKELFHRFMVELQRSESWAAAFPILERYAQANPVPTGIFYLPQAWVMLWQSAKAAGKLPDVSVNWLYGGKSENPLQGYKEVLPSFPVNLYASSKVSAQGHREDFSTPSVELFNLIEVVQRIQELGDESPLKWDPRGVSTTLQPEWNEFELDNRVVMSLTRLGFPQEMVMAILNLPEHEGGEAAVKVRLTSRSPYWPLIRKWVNGK